MTIEAISESEITGWLGEEERGTRDQIGLRVSSVAAHCLLPFWRVEEVLHRSFLPFRPGAYGQKNTLIHEVVHRILWGALYVPSLLTLLPLAGLGLVLKGASFLLTSTSYQFEKGTFQKKARSSPHFLFLNPHMLSGGVPFAVAGLAPARERLSRLISTLRENDPDFVFLTEINTETRQALTDALREHYHFFFSTLNQHFLSGDASFFIAFRGNIVKPPKFIPFKQPPFSIERGFFTIETADTLYVCTSLPAVQDLEQLIEIEQTEKKVILLGELGFDRHSESYKLLSQNGFVSYLEEGTSTGSNAPLLFLQGEKKEEAHCTDERVLIKGGTEAKVEVIPQFLPEKLDEALSDQSLILIKTLA